MIVNYRGQAGVATVFISILAAITGSIWAFSGFLDKSGNVAFKNGCRNYIIQTQEDDILKDWSSHLYSTFILIYSDKQLSLKCIKRSFLTSFIFVIIGFILVELIFLGFIPYYSYFTDHPLSFLSILWNNLGVTLVIIFITNGIADFFSVWETRFIFRKMSETNKLSIALCLLIFDILISGVIFSSISFMIVVMAEIIFNINSTEEFMHWLPSFETIPSEYKKLSDRTYFNNFDYSPFYVVVLFLSAYLSTFISTISFSLVAYKRIKLSIKKLIFSLLGRLIDIENSPIQTVGLFLILLIWSFFGIVFILI